MTTRTAARTRAGYATLGDGVFAKLAAGQRVSAGELFARRRFFLVYSEVQLDKLCELRKPDGMPLSWAAVKALVRVAAPSARRKLEVKAAREGMSAGQLRAMVTGKRRAGIGGRPVKRPASAETGLATAIADAERLARFLNVLAVADDAVLTHDNSKKRTISSKSSELAASALASLRKLEDSIRAANKGIRRFRRG